MIEFTSEQKELGQILKTWYHKRSKQYISYSGAAGTGKTTVIEALIDELGLEKYEVAAVAYVGKAVLGLLRHDLQACTIHSLIYHVCVEKEQDPETQAIKTKLSFVLKSQLDPKIKLIVVDEAAMVNDKIRDDLLSFGLPVIFIGDMNQLPPVFGISSVMRNPDYILTKIMRQAEGNYIVYLSQQVLAGKDLEYGEYGNSRIIETIPVDNAMLKDYNIIICGKNKTRDLINTRIRSEVLRLTSPYPSLGEKMICRQNNWDCYNNGIYLTNGLIGYITDIDYMSAYKGYMNIDFQPDFMESEFEGIKLDSRYLKCAFDEKKDYGISRYNKFEYAYAITCHLSQGSEYDNVLFIDEPFWNRDFTKKLRYTAITRARESITIVK